MATQDAASLSRGVLAVIGVGGMGRLVAQRLGAGRHVVLADYSEEALKSTAASLEAEGHKVATHTVDVSDYASVLKLAQDTQSLGPIAAIVHTAGVSPVQASAEKVYQIDLLGTANVIEAFATVATKGTSLVCISSMAGHLLPLSPALEQHLGRAPREQLLNHPEITSSENPYGVAKRGNVLRVQAAAKLWGLKGARLNSISPGIIDTPMGQAELNGPAGHYMRAMIEASGSGRMGLPDDIANATAFLVGAESSFITGTDILVDGGVVAGTRWAGAFLDGAK